MDDSNGRDGAEDEHGERRPTRGVVLVALAFVLVYTVLTVVQMRVVGDTVDETSYFNSGRLIREAGWIHPLTRLHGPLPYYANQLFVGAFPDGGWEEAEDPGALLFRGRLGLLPFGWLTAWVLFTWTRRVWGDRAGLLSLALFALHPTWIAYSGLLVTDVCHTATVLLCFWFLWRDLPRPSWRGALLTGIALGVSFGTKYLALLNGPLVVLAAAGRAAWVRRHAGSSRPAATGRFFATALLVTAAAIGTLHACYGLRAGFAPPEREAYASDLIGGLVDTPVVGLFLRSFPSHYLAGVDYQMNVGEAQHLTPYLNGRFDAGHPTYYLWASFRKNPELVFALVLLGCAVFARRLASGRARFAETTTFCLLVPPVLVSGLYLSLFTALQIGVRYVLPACAAALIFAGASASTSFVARASTRRFAAGLATLTLLGSLDLARNWPNLLGYYNVISGGQSHGYRWFSDSNTDWGQYARTGPTRLAARSPAVELVPKFNGPRLGPVAIRLRDLVRPDPLAPSHLRHWLLTFEPVEHIGGAFWLFEPTVEEWTRRATQTQDERVRFELAVALYGADERDAALEQAALLARAPRSPEEPQPGVESGEDSALPLGLRFDAFVEGVEAARRAPESFPAFLAGVTAWSGVGRYDRAAELCASATPSVRKHAQFPLVHGRVLTRLERLEEALVVFESGPATMPELANLRCQLLLELQRPAEAVRFLEGLRFRETVLVKLTQERRATFLESYEKARNEAAERRLFFGPLGGDPKAR